MGTDMRKAIICDLDGTLFLRGDRGPYEHEKSVEDPICEPVRWLLSTLHEAGMPILLVTGREEKYASQTQWALAFHHIHFYTDLWFRPTGDLRPDEIVKREIYEAHIAPQYDIVMVLDDRNRVVKMWRELGLVCLQVAEGNF